MCFLEGFSGTGKTNALLPRLRQRLTNQDVATVMVEVGEPGPSQFADLLLDLAQELAMVGREELATAIDHSGDATQVAAALERVFSQPILVVVDEFQKAVDPSSGEPVGDIGGLIKRVARRPQWPGRLLILTNRLLSRGRWSEAHCFETLPTLDARDGRSYLDFLLRKTDREQEVAPDRRDDIVAWVGGNPRAMQLVVAALTGVPLDGLIGLAPEAWELRHRAVSATLLEKLEREVLQKVLDHLDTGSHRLLTWASVLRRPVKAAALDAFSPDRADSEGLRQTLSDRFLLTHERGWYTLNPVGREVGRHLLQRKPSDWRRANAIAADHYARHFKARQITGGARLGGHFVEVRYHLVQAGREKELTEIVHRFGAHLRAEIGLNTRVPTDRRQLDERIAVLSAFLAHGGPKALEYHLARCLVSRGQDHDLRRALDHSRRAVGSDAPADAWLLRMELEAVQGDSAMVLGTLREGLRQLGAGRGVEPLYLAGARFLERRGKVEDALTLLQEGLDEVPADKSLFSLYQLASELLARAGRIDDALDLLRRGIAEIPADKNLFSLYQLAGELLARAGRIDDALDLLRRGIAEIPADKNLFSLYQLAGELLARVGRIDDALDLLRRGIAEISPDQGLFSLYQLAGALLVRSSRFDEGFALFEEGVERIPAGRFAQYKLFESELYSALAFGRSDLLELVRARAERAGQGPQEGLARILQLQLAEDWKAAAETARALRKDSPHYLQFAIQEAYSWLCAGDANSARDSLATYPLVHGKGLASTWLACFVALRAGRMDEAGTLWATYLDHPASGPEPPSEEILLRIWDEPAPLSQPHPAYYYPRLPPSLSGLDRTLSRKSLSHSVLQAARIDPPERVDRATRRSILVIATEWRSRHGGLSTFNRRLCSELAAAGQEVVCLLPSATEHELGDAELRGVRLSIAASVGAQERERLFGRPPLPEGFLPEVVVGHGRITGPAAVAQVEERFPEAARVHVVHMAPGEIEWLKEEPEAASRSENRERLELELCRTADLVVAVGPRLTREVGNLLSALPEPRSLHRFDPGVDTVARREPPPGLHVLVMGRAEDLRLKGLDIAAAAMARLPHPQPRPFQSEPILVVRGAPAGTGDEVHRQLRGLAAGVGWSLRVREYTDDQQRLSEDLLRSTVVLMPSRSEGFGLVGLEAISAGVPVLISDRSGLAELLIECLGAVEASSYVVATSASTDGLEADATAWARAIEFVLRDPAAAFVRAARLLERLSEKLDWKTAVAGLLDALPTAPAPKRPTPGFEERSALR